MKVSRIPPQRAQNARRGSRLVVVLLIAVMAATTAFAQSRGRGRMSGKIVDEQGKGIEGVEVRILRAGDAQGLVVKSNDKGEWTHNNLAAGQWTVEFNKEGLEVIQHAVTLADAQRLPAMSVTMKPAPPDPTVVINAELQRAVEFVKAGQIVEARKVYEGLVEKYPTVYQLHSFVARAYAGENNLPKAIEHLQIALDKEPANTEYQLLMAELYLMSDKRVEARKILDAVDMTKVQDPFPFLNAAIHLINEGKGDEAVATIDKLIKQFPNDNSLYYYRGRALIVSKKFDEAKADFEKYMSLRPECDAVAKADATAAIAAGDKTKTVTSTTSGTNTDIKVLEGTCKEYLDAKKIVDQLTKK